MTAARDITPAAMLLQARVRVPQEVVFRSFPKETVVLNLETGLYHGINPTGGRMLETLAKVGSVSEAATALAAQYEVPPEELQADLCGFCEALLERGLLVIE